MLINQVNLQAFRNIKAASFKTDKQVNVFYGQNGSGKTSILESLFYLSRARSFRTSKKQHLLNTGSPQFIVNVELRQSDTNHKLGIGYDEQGQTQLKLDGELIQKLSEASSLMPTQIITPESFEVFFSTPKARRSFFDFGLFHVEHEFQNSWASYARLLKQTNALLKSPRCDMRELQFWYRNLIEAGEVIERFRETFFEELFSKAVKELATEIEKETNSDLISELEVRYKSRKFAPSNDFEQSLYAQIEKDKKYKQVGFGPNRADIIFYKNGEDVTNKLSRGQSKLLFYLLEIAMVNIIRRQADKNILLLVDDLPSEVDEDTRSTMLKVLLHSEAQIFVTGIENKIAKEFLRFTQSVNLFHVEHGKIRPENMEQLCP